MPYTKKRINFDLDKLEIVSVLGTVKQSTKSRVRVVVESYNSSENYVAIYAEYKRETEPDDEGYWKISKKIKLSKIDFKNLMIKLVDLGIHKNGNNLI